MTRRVKLAIAGLALAALAGTGCGRTPSPAPAVTRAPAATTGTRHRSRTVHTPAPAATATPPPQAAAPPEPPGGPVGAVQTYFDDLAGHRYGAAYALLSPTWRGTHTFASFRAGLSAGSPRLQSARIRSAADFNATVALTVRTASGRTLHLSAALVDLAQGPASTGFAAWRLAQPIPVD